MNLYLAEYVETLSDSICHFPPKLEAVWIYWKEVKANMQQVDKWYHHWQKDLTMELAIIWAIVLIWKVIYVLYHLYMNLRICLVIWGWYIPISWIWKEKSGRFHCITVVFSHFAHEQVMIRFANRLDYYRSRSITLPLYSFPTWDEPWLYVHKLSFIII